MEKLAYEAVEKITEKKEREGYGFGLNRRYRDIFRERKFFEGLTEISRYTVF